MSVENYMLTGGGPYENHLDEGKCVCGGKVVLVPWCFNRNRACLDPDCGVLDDDIADCVELDERHVCGNCGRVI